MNKFFRENWFKLLMVGFFIIALSIVYYFVLFLPKGSLRYGMSAKQEMEMRVQCQDIAKKYFNGDYNRKLLAWSPDLDKFKSHYNKKLNKCFIQINASNNPNFPYEIFLYDILDNIEYGQYTEVKGKDDNPKLKICVVSKNECNNMDEFENLVKPYMEE